MSALFNSDSDIHLSAKEFQLIAKVTEILVYFEQATKILSKPDASIAMSIPIITTIQKYTPESWVNFKNFVLPMKNSTSFVTIL